MNIQKMRSGLFFSTLLVMVLLAGSVTSGISQSGGSPPGVVNGVYLPAAALAPADLALAPDPLLAGPGVLHLGAEAFQAYFPNTTWARSDLLLRATNPSGSFPFDAPVFLPNGSEIKQIVLYYVDNDPTADLSIYFVHTTSSASVGIADLTASSTGAVPGVRALPITGLANYTIDNGTNNYFVRVNLGGSKNLFLKSVRIDYGYSANLPALSK